MGRISLSLLTETDLGQIHSASLQILERTGTVIHHSDILKRLADVGARVNQAGERVFFPPELVEESLAKAGRRYTLFGRDPKKNVAYGDGHFSLMSSPGQYSWIDLETGLRRSATLTDAVDAIRLGDALENIHVVGAMAQPEEFSDRYRDVALTAELLKRTTKPTRCWVKNGATAEYIIELYAAVAGGRDRLRRQPMVEAFLEPISPLQFPETGLEIVKVFTEAGQPVSIGPMAMASGTAPATLAGTLALENAEILASIVIIQSLAPGCPVMYGGIPHIMDPKTSICSFGSPEQGLMAAAMVEIARSYGFPCYVNAGLTDAKVPDAQAGIEKASSMILAALAGADTFGHSGICGTDHAGSLLWLVLDAELFDFVKRIARGFEVNEETLATSVIDVVGPAGNFLAEYHTVEHFRRELWLPSDVWTRQNFEQWRNEGQKSIADRLTGQVRHILDTHEVEPLEPKLSAELDRIVAAAKEL
ncbi:MAG: trimethylamine methyltransferase family protein [Acidobacteriota bacterium]|nr:MAG: trimethylamine methyltransferase family protein [Acidobacteriota bacterium]